MDLEDDYRDLDPSCDLTQLLEIMRRLRDPETGCPWDLKQTFTSVAPYTVEEAYEVQDAIERDDMGDLCDELGDLLLQVVYHSQMAKERGAFDFDDVVKTINAKMIRRHPHVFGTTEQRQNGLKPGEWERIKAAERTAKEALKNQQNPSNPSRLLDSVPATLPSLNRAIKLQKRAASVGFDWDDINLVFDKLREEFSELEQECAELKTSENPLNTQDIQARMLDEMGDILFVAVNLARHLKIDPEAALSSTNVKFINRFNYVEDALTGDGRTLNEASLDEMEALWQSSKSKT